jgi:hypothetical protein
MKFIDAVKAFLKWLADFVKDKNDGSDEKRLMGVAFLICALIYVFTRPAGPDVWTIAGGLAGVGVILLGVAGAQDGIVPKISSTPSAPSTTGIPGAADPQ